MSRIVPLFLALATSTAFAPVLVSADTLTITISNIRVSEGWLMVQVANSEQGFEFAEDSAPAPVAISQLAEAGEMTFEVALQPGLRSLVQAHVKRIRRRSDTGPSHQIHSAAIRLPTKARQRSFAHWSARRSKTKPVTCCWGISSPIIVDLVTRASMHGG